MYLADAPGLPGGAGTPGQPIVIDPIEVIAKRPPLWSPLAGVAAIALGAWLVRLIGGRR